MKFQVGPWYKILSGPSVEEIFESLQCVAMELEVEFTVRGPENQEVKISCWVQGIQATFPGGTDGGVVWKLLLNPTSIFPNFLRAKFNTNKRTGMCKLLPSKG